MNRKTFFKQLGLVAGGCLCLPFISLNPSAEKNPRDMTPKEYYLHICEEVYQNHTRGVTRLVNPEEYNKYMQKANLEYFKKTVTQTNNKAND